MIYDFPEPSSSVSQGDIFFGIPILDLPDDELPVMIDDKGSVQMLPWGEFASAGEKVSAIISVRPTIAIVGTQECDALRAPSITLFEVRPFRDVERKSKDTSKPAKWVPIITQHARVNQKWFYLPADERIGFSEKMGADFLTPIRVPRLALERLIGFRKGRLNEVAGQHFRERLAEFFRRYAYDEWYPLTREELAEYQKNHPDVEPFPWQRENRVSDDKRSDKKVAGVAVSEYDGNREDRRAYLIAGNEAVGELSAMFLMIATEGKNVGDKFGQYASQLKRLSAKPGRQKAQEFKRVTSIVASGMNTFSKRMEDILPKLEKNTQVLEENFSAYVSFIRPGLSDDIQKVLNLRNSLSHMSVQIRQIKETMTLGRDSTLSLLNQYISEEVNSAASRQSQALDGVISNMEEVESFALRVIFLIDEKFGEPPNSEDKAE